MNRLLAAAAASVLLAGCGGPNEKARVTVEYAQLANFSRPDGGAFALYRITRIVNTESKAQPFAFDPKRAASATGGAPPGDEKALLGTYLAPAVAVSAGETRPVAGCLVRRVSAPGAAPVDLRYADDARQPVSMVRSSTTVRGKLLTKVNDLLLRLVASLGIKGSSGSRGAAGAPRHEIQLLAGPAPRDLQIRCNTIVF